MKQSKYKEVEIAKALIFLFLIISFSLLFGQDNQQIEEVTNNHSHNYNKTIVVSSNNHNYKKGNYRKRYWKPKKRFQSVRLFLDLQRLKRDCKLIRIKYNKISSNVFEDKFYLKYSLSTIVSDNSFKLMNINDLEDLYQQYFNEVTFDINKIEINFNMYILNSFGFSVADQRFYHDIKKIKRKYYLHIILKEIYEKGNIYKEQLTNVIMENKGFRKLFNSTEYIIEAKSFMDQSELEWSEIDENLEKISKKIKAKIYLDKKEKNLVEVSVLLKRLYIFFLNQQEEMQKFNSGYYNITSIIKDKEFIRIIGYKNIQSHAKSLLKSQKGDINWDNINSLTQKFIENRIRFKDAKKDRTIYNSFEYFSSLQEQYKKYLREKNVIDIKPIKVKKCNTNCVNNCKVKFDLAKEYLECAKESCNCTELEILDVLFANKDSVLKNNDLGLFSYLCIVFSLFVILFISFSQFKKSFIISQQENSEITYELLTENENEIKI